MNPHIVKAVQMAGGQKALAQLCGCTQAAVSKWFRGFGISAESALAIERATNGQVTARDLRPDIFGEAPGISPVTPSLPAHAEPKAAAA